MAGRWSVRITFWAHFDAIKPANPGPDPTSNTVFPPSISYPLVSVKRNLANISAHSHTIYPVGSVLGGGVAGAFCSVYR